MLQAPALTASCCHHTCTGLAEAQEGLDEWILRMVRDDRLRQAACERLAAHAARPFMYPQSEVMVTL